MLVTEKDHFLRLKKRLLQQQNNLFYLRNDHLHHLEMPSLSQQNKLFCCERDGVSRKETYLLLTTNPSSTGLNPKSASLFR